MPALLAKLGKLMPALLAKLGKSLLVHGYAFVVIGNS